MIALAQIQDIMAQLPNPNDLSLSAFRTVVDKSISPEMGTTLRGRFGRKLHLHRLANEDLINVLLETPTGLHFTEVQIHSVHESHLPIVRLVEACRKTLVKLSYAHGKSHHISGPIQTVTLPTTQLTVRPPHGLSTFPNSPTSEKWTLTPG